MKVEFKLGVVTPLIMSGADQNEFELRETSIVGAMRYWFRKLYGDVKEEKEIFGSTDAKGKFGVRIIKQNFGHKKSVSREIKPNNPAEGMNYLLGFFRSSGGVDRKGVETGKFSLLLNFDVKNEPFVKKILGSLWAVIFIGGLGTRSRRGFGSLEVLSVDDKDLERYFIIRDLSLGNFYKSAFDYFEFKNSIPIYVIEDFDVVGFKKSVDDRKRFNRPLRTKYRRFPSDLYDLRPPFKNAEDALNFIGNTMQYFRSYLEPDYSFAKNAALSQNNLNPKEIWRSDFGAPIQFFFRRLGKSKVEERIPSRLIVRVIKEKGKYYPVLILDKSRKKASKYKNDLAELYIKSLNAKKVI